LNKIKTIIENPKWSFIGTLFGILTFFAVRLNMDAHIIIQYTILTIALFLAVYGSYCLLKQKNISDTIKLINVDDFDTIENPGVAIHKKSQEIFCLKCLMQKNIKSPLIIDHSKGYMCRNCENFPFR
jgi:hypothetical protein